MSNSILERDLTEHPKEEETQDSKMSADNVEAQNSPQTITASEQISKSAYEDIVTAGFTGTIYYIWVFFTALWALGKNASYYTTYHRATFWPTALAIPQFICAVLILGVSFNMLISVVGSSTKKKFCKCETLVKIWLYATPIMLLALLLLDIWAITFNALGFRQVSNEDQDDSKELIPGSARDVDNLVNLISILSIIFNVTVTLFFIAVNFWKWQRMYKRCSEIMKLA